MYTKNVPIVTKIIRFFQLDKPCMAHKTDYLGEQNQKIFLHFILISFDSNVDLALGITLNNAAQNV